VASSVVITGGGTAGHVTPGLALAGELTRRGHDVRFVGTDRGVEARLVPAAGYDLLTVPSRPFERRVSLRAVRAPVATIAAVGGCRTYVRDALAVVGMGGYASVPAALAARREHVPVVLHEQNAVPGLANRALARVARAVALSFGQARTGFPRTARVEVTGNPVREEILRVRADRALLAEEARRSMGLEPDRRTVVVFGGSLGALQLNRAALGACRLLADRADVQVVLITGPSHLEALGRGVAGLGGGPGRILVRLEGFVDRMELVYAVADLMVARGGASAIAEITAVGIPSVLVPYPHAVAREQDANARAVQLAGGASLMMDRDVTGESLAGRMVNLVDHPERLAAMAGRAAAFGRPDAASALADLVEEVAGGGA
jgi:UDP-N-acetylglucosamine--N-acetylmuramyl-(pentapeptide) pyrophosphoryl-undecaprenol N-acetylglucosamine transferase